MPLKVSISGVRGTPDALTKAVIEDFAKAYATYLGQGKIVIGSDTRPNSDEIKNYVINALVDLGIDCIDTGITPTPTIGVYVREKKLAGGIMITASHNPLPWNGIKLMRNDGIFLNETQAKKLIEIFESKKFKKSGKLGNATKTSNAIDIHIDKILSVIDSKPIQAKKYKVVVDPGNGASYVAAPRLLKKLGCEVISIHDDPAKVFERPPEPTPKALQKLCEKVKATKAAVGFAIDPDADRLSLVDNTGTPLSEELSIVLATDCMLGRNPQNKNVVTNLSTTMALDDIVKKHGGQVLRTKIGEVHVSEKMKELGSEIGGEGNGGVIYPKVGFNRDSLVGMAIILSYMAQSNKKLSSLAESVPKYYSIKDKIEVSNNDDAQALIEKTKKLFKNKKQDLTDGVKVIFPDEWLHVRASNTEPIVRIYGEGKDLKQITDLCNQIKNYEG
ncbi:MAG: phosphoglucosamine mutase [Candidatus Margulisbacteria bacterium]|nr:phosphoglucosamine mutase [Candidatus Margulisiibacteriota bacterium]MBU1021188.1 phosphoglucosamine mutase [Candidatus Margulisiibacteriota bacterium]MBU1729794.1 phosphoglucosamine mutase [Candidatus Margulisiibacteriota bacterium]MBU1955295.1 phosphoglucosamine mutase [Candidatus Margulisiibacteriota bacterium]